MKTRVSPEELEEFRRQVKNMHGNYPTIPPKVSDDLHTILSKSKKNPSKWSQNRTRQDTKSQSAEESHILYNTFEFDDSSQRPKTRLPKDPAVALDRVKKNQQKLLEFQTTDPEGAKKLKERETWNKAIDKARGIAVRDDPKLLKRSLLRKEKLKEKRRRKWEERQEQIREDKLEKQEKRQNNIQLRKEAKKRKNRGK